MVCHTKPVGLSQRGQISGPDADSSSGTTVRFWALLDPSPRLIALELVRPRPSSISIIIKAFPRRISAGRGRVQVTSTGFRSPIAERSHSHSVLLDVLHVFLRR